MVKKFICPICGYVHEGTEAPERCPQCKQIVEWKVASDDKLSFACEHILGVAKDEKDPIIAEGLRAHFIGECTEVGQYLAMARQADREGYPEVAEAFRRYAYEEADHASRFAELLGDVPARCGGIVETEVEVEAERLETVDLVVELCIADETVGERVEPRPDS